MRVTERFGARPEAQATPRSLGLVSCIRMTEGEPAAAENPLSDHPRGYTLVLLRVQEEGGITTVV